jgi:hypothetical protein
MTDLARRHPWLAPALLLVVLALGLLPTSGPVRLAGPEGAAGAITAVLDEVPPGSNVLVGFDADLGTYAEIRPTVRALIDDLLERDANLVVVSLTPEGRALAVAERSRLLADGTAAEQILDGGFVPGGEAALVRVSAAIGGDRGGIVQGLPRDPIAMGLVVGGNDIGPRSWVEQVAPRVDALPLVAVAPSALLPELQPYLDSGQLRALLATPRDGAAYREAAGSAGEDGPGPVAVLVGVLVAIGAIGIGVVSRLGEALRAAGGERES